MLPGVEVTAEVVKPGTDELPHSARGDPEEAEEPPPSAEVTGRAVGAHESEVTPEDDRHQRKYRIRHPNVFQLGVDAMTAGIPQEALLDEFVRLRADLHEIALRFVTLFTDHILRSFLDQGMPKDELPVIVERLKRLRQLAVEATDALMRQAIADEIEVVARANLPVP